MLCRHLPCQRTATTNNREIEVVFSACLFCHNTRGRNEVLESFRFGRRLAFDSVRGRLWVVCVQCANWNLSPLGSTGRRWNDVSACTAPPRCA